MIEVVDVIEYLGVHIEAGEVTKEIKKLNREQDKGPEMLYQKFVVDQKRPYHDTI